MIDSITIRNFRGIANAEVVPTARINVLVGPNGTGKSAFLEAIFIALGNSPELIVRTKSWRGREMQYAGDTRSITEALWADTFKDPDLGYSEIVLGGRDGGHRLRIDRTNPTQIIPVSGSSPIGEVGVRCTWQHKNEQPYSISPRFTPNGLEMGFGVAGATVNFIPARANMPESETAAAFSNLSVAGQQDTFVRTFLNEFPWLEDVSVEAPLGNPALYARLPSRRKLPLSMISGGISYIAGMMLRVAANKNSYLIVDEIENGIFHERYLSVWRALYALAVEMNCQIFASTHSLECLRALAAALEHAPSEVCFIRTQLEDGEVAIQQTSGEMLFDALQIGDVR